MKTLLVGALAALVLLAAVVVMFSATRTPNYEASAVLLVGQKEQSDGKIQPIPNYHPHRLGGRQALAQVMVIAIETRPVAEEVVAPGGRPTIQASTPGPRLLSSGYSPTRGMGGVISKALPGLRSRWLR